MTFSWGTLGAHLVGIVFLSTGLAKAADPRLFAEHLQRLGVAPLALVNVLTGGAIVFECGWGTALVLGVAPTVVYPATLGLLAGLTALTLWSTGTGRTADCGCYVGLASVSPRRSVLLNAGYAVLVAGAWALSPPSPSGTGPAFWAVGGGALTGGGLAAVTYGYRLRYGTPLIDRRPLRPGRAWSADWFEENIVAQEGDELVAFLAPGCSACVRWLRVLRVVHEHDELPRVVGLVLASPDGATEYGEERGFDLPTAPVDPDAAQRFVRHTPTAVRLNDGRIADTWVGTMPAAFVQQVKTVQAATS